MQGTGERHPAQCSGGGGAAGAGSPLTAFEPELPAAATPFVGRETDLAEIVALLAAPDCRLLTLLGPGGSGKTRLALQAAAQARGRGAFSGGAHVVILQSLATADLLVSAIADALRLPPAGAGDPEAQLLAFLRGRSLLLVLDNFEHLLAGAGLLAAILAAAPGVKLLVTSREALSLQEEWRYPVQGLPYPDGEDASDPEQHAAVRLFAERARRVRRDFSLAEEGPAVARICRLVEGLPLALELAAAWAGAVPCRELAADLALGLEGLAARLRDVPERHRSMRAVFDQSWARLEAEERTAFARLSAFRGRFRLEAAEAVAGASSRTLSALVDKSLLRLTPDGRYQLHELLRQYAAGRLWETPGEAAGTRDRHGAYYVGLLAALYEGLIGPGQVEALGALAPELDDVRAAWGWAMERSPAETRRRAVHAAALGCDFRGRYREGVALLEQAVEGLRGAGGADAGPGLAAALVDLGRLYTRLGRLERAAAALEEAESLYTRLGLAPPPGLATDPLLHVGWLAYARGERDEAVRLGEAARRRAEAHGHTGNLPYAWNLLTLVAYAGADRALEKRAAGRAYAAVQDSQDRWFTASCLNQLGGIAIRDGDFAAARRHFQASYEIRAAFGDANGMALALMHLGGVDERQGDHAAALGRYLRAERIFEESGDAVDLTRALRDLGRATTALGDRARARDAYARALRVSGDHRLARLLLDTMLWATNLLVDDGHAALAVEVVTLVRRHPAADVDDRGLAAEVLERAAARLAPAELATAEQRGRDGDVSRAVARLQEVLARPAVPAAAPGVAPPAAAPGALPVEPLSARELDVLRLLAEGRSNQEIARALIVAVGTVKTHVHNLCGKLDAPTRGRAVARARELGLLALALAFAPGAP
jgi:predicted ATPase/DNA-binding CsgD family transcriptional regulator